MPTVFRIVRQSDGHYWTLSEEDSQLVADACLMQSREVTHRPARECLRNVADWMRGLL